MLPGRVRDPSKVISKSMIRIWIRMDLHWYGTQDPHIIRGGGGGAYTVR